MFRDETPDYGIDGEVEIFDNAGNSTGVRFHVQLKATDRLDSSFASQVRLRRETVDYYLSLSRPILLVSYLCLLFIYPRAPNLRGLLTQTRYDLGQRPPFSIGQAQATLEGKVQTADPLGVRVF